jgi:endonuclease YncB( thermonuclease family)
MHLGLRVLSCCVLVCLLYGQDTRAQSTADCSAFDAWVWAQTVYESDPGTFNGLDPDGNGLACENLPIYAFAPVIWTDSIPSGSEAAQVTNITDGDTFDVMVNGVPDTIRMYHMNTPETSFEQECGGDDATAFLRFVLQFAPGGTVYLEYDETQRDEFDRRLAYVWYELAGDVYLVNEAMVRTGWAESKTYRPDVKYKEELDAAEQFSVDHVLGVRLQCGKFGQTVGSTANAQQVRQAEENQPNQGQFAGISSDQPSNDQGSGDPPAPEPTRLPQPSDEEPPQEQPATGGCDPNYTGGCVPIVSYDLDCPDIGFSVTVVGVDTHGFDGDDNDGYGCESY